MSRRDRVAITGLGVFCPIGGDPETILSALREGRSGIRPVTRYASEHLHSKLAGELPFSVSDSGHLRDQSSDLAVAAARQAMESAALLAHGVTADRIGLCVGGSGAGLNHGSAHDAFSLSYQPHEQASAVASALGIAGPIVMFTSASVGSGLALVHAMNLLQTRRCDLVIAGGAESLSQVNHESMDSMRFCSLNACSPFSGESGLTVGEGSAFFVLERFPDAISRGATILSELYAFGVTQDGYDVIGGDPSGDGLRRAFLRALDSAGISPSEIDWIKANGTSNREQDAAETLAVKQVFRTPPPITGVESFVGHANGAAPAIGLGIALIALRNGLVPPTLNFQTLRAGCDLDYVPNTPRLLTTSRVLASSVGFGGSNVALVFGVPSAARSLELPESELCITGVGVVSAFGAGLACFIHGLRCGVSAITLSCDNLVAGLITELRAQRLSPKLTLLQLFASVAAEEAFRTAALTPDHYSSSRIGLLVGLCRGSAHARAQYATALNHPEARKAMSKIVLRMGRFTVASHLSQRFHLKGYGATISEGFGAGLHALAHACIQLENSPADDAVLVVATDETGTGPASSLEEKGWLAAGHDGCYLKPFTPDSTGTILGEGAVALLVERTSYAVKRGAHIRARIQGVALSSRELATSIGDAVRQAKCDVRDINCAYGNGSGIWSLDQSELRALRQSLPGTAPIGCVNSGLGFAESSGSLFQVAAAIHGISEGEFFPVQGPFITGEVQRHLVTASSEGHRSASVILGG